MGKATIVSQPQNKAWSRISRIRIFLDDEMFVAKQFRFFRRYPMAVRDEL
jgi:hypothetical protein